MFLFSSFVHVTSPALPDFQQESPVRYPFSPERQRRQSLFWSRADYVFRVKRSNMSLNAFVFRLEYVTALGGIISSTGQDLTH